MSETIHHPDGVPVGGDHEASSEKGRDEGIEAPPGSLARVIGDTDEAERELLRNAVLKLLASLHALHGPEFTELMETRANGDSSAVPPADTKGPAEMPRPLRDQKMVRVGPASGIGLVLALNEGPKTYVADLFKTAPQKLNQGLKCHLHLCEAISGSLAIRDPESRKLHALTSFEQTAFVLGLQPLSTMQPGLSFHGKDSISCIVDMALYAMHNGEALRRLMTGVCVAARGIKTVKEAAWFANVAASVESKTGLGEGKLRVSLVIDSPECVESADAIIRTLGERLVGVRLDAESVALASSRGGDKAAIEGAESGTGALAESMKTIATLCHSLGVTAVWDGPAPDQALHLFKSAAVDGFACGSQSESDAIQEAAEEAFDGANQLESSPSGKVPSPAKPSPWDGELNTFMADIAREFAASDTGISRSQDLAVGKLLRAHSQGDVEEKSIRDALRSLRKQDMPASLTSGISSALRGLMRADGTDVSRLSTAMERQSR